VVTSLEAKNKPKLCRGPWANAWGPLWPIGFSGLANMATSINPT